MNRFNYKWLAGLMDGDGCFSISIRVDKRNNTISVCPHVFIGLKGNDSWIIDYIFKETNIGHIYYSNKGKENEICRWEVCSYNDVIKITNKLLPFLILKKKKALLFKKSIDKYFKTSVSFKKRWNGKRRSNAELKFIIKNSLDLNKDRQSVRYRNKKDWLWWDKKIDELYPK